MVLLAAWGYHLKAYGLLYSTQGPAFGASYTDVNIKDPGLQGFDGNVYFMVPFYHL
jgi:uncharacterized membrane protein (UPF0182 family)